MENSNLEIEFEQFITRYKTYQLILLIKNNWNFFRKRLPESDLTTYGLIDPKSSITQEIIGLLISISKSDLTKYYIIDKKEAKSLDKEKLDRFKKMGKIDKDLLSNAVKTKLWRTASEYEQTIQSYSEKLQYDFVWDNDIYDWEPIQTQTLLPENFLKPEIPNDISGTWYLYKYAPFGVERMILTIGNHRGQHSVKIQAKRDKEETSFEAYSGNAFVDKDLRTIFLMEDYAERYAHLILFTKRNDVPKTDARTVAIGHFTFFNQVPGVEKYLTQTVAVLRPSLLSEAGEEKSRHLKNEFDCKTEDELLVFRYLKEKQKNRLASISSPVYTPVGFELFFNAQERKEK